MCKEIIPIFLCVALLLSFTLPEISDYTIREFIYGVQDTTAVVRGTRIACEIIAVSNPGYVVYTIYAIIPSLCMCIASLVGALQNTFLLPQRIRIQSQLSYIQELHYK